jgi:hypothetical protein
MTLLFQISFNYPSPMLCGKSLQGGRDGVKCNTYRRDTKCLECCSGKAEGTKSLAMKEKEKIILKWILKK